MSRIDFKKNLPAPKYERRPGFINFRVGMFRLPSAWRSRTRPKFDKIRSRCVCNMKNDPHRSNKKIVVGYPLQRCKLWHRLYFGLLSEYSNTPKWDESANTSKHFNVSPWGQTDIPDWWKLLSRIISGASCHLWVAIFVQPDPYNLLISCFIAAAIYMCNMCTQCLGISSLFGDTIY